MLDKYKVILWDFDGVLLDSNSVRDLGFRKVLSSYPEESVDLLLDFHKANGGLSRYVKFRYFFENILNQGVTEQKINALSSEFSLIMREVLTSPELIIQDSMSFVRQKFEQGIKMHIVSGSDQKELRFLCNELKIGDYFISIHGSPTPKNQLVKDLIKSNNYNKAEITLIGDSINDLEAANINGIDFFGYNNERLKVSENYIDHFQYEISRKL